MNYFESPEEAFKKIEKLLQLEESKAIKSAEALVEFLGKKFNEGNFPDEQPFHKWFFKSVASVATFFALALSIVLLASTVSNEQGRVVIHLFKAFSFPKFWLYYYEALVILLVIVTILLRVNYDRHNVKSKTIKRGKRAIKALWGFWLWLWIGWLALYAILAFGEQNPDILPRYWSASLSDFCNNLTGAMFFCLYYELARKTQDKSSLSPSSKLLILWFLISIVVLGLEITLLQPLDSSSDIFKETAFYFALLSGLTSGVVTLLFIARLESIFFHIPLPWVVSLSLYVVIQPLYIFLEGSPFVKGENIDSLSVLSLVIFMFAFWAKISLLTTLHWARDTDRLLYYMVRRLQIYMEEKEGKYRDKFLFTLGKLPEFKASESKDNSTENPE